MDVDACLVASRNALAAVRDGLDACDAAQVAAVLGRLAVIEGLLASTQARALARAGRLGVARDHGASSMTAWLADTTGLAARDASQRTRRAKVLASLGDTDDALAAGRVTAHHVDTIVRSVVDGTFGDAAETQDALLPAAVVAGADDFARTVRRDGAVRDEARTARAAELAHRRRQVRFVHHRDGTVSMHSRLHATAGTLLERTVDAMVVPDPAGTPEAERRTPAQRRADALMDLVGAAVAAGAPPESGGVRPHLHVLVPFERLAPRSRPPAPAPSRAVPPSIAPPSVAPPTAQPSTPGPAGLSGPSVGPAELDGSGPISSPELHRLLCDAGVTRIVTAGASQVIDVGRETRVWPVATRKAVAARDRGCRWPGCRRSIAWTDVHHVMWWERGGATNVANGVLLCGFHHHLVHDGGWTLDMDPITAIVTVTNATGAVIRTSHPPGLAPPTLADLARAGPPRSDE